MKNLSPFMLFVSGQKRISRNGTLEKQQVSGVCFKARDGVKRVLFLSFILLSRPSSEFGSFNPTLQHLVIRSVFSDGTLRDCDCLLFYLLYSTSLGKLNHTSIKQQVKTTLYGLKEMGIKGYPSLYSKGRGISSLLFLPHH